MAEQESPSIFATLQKDHRRPPAPSTASSPASCALAALEDNPMNRFSMAEDEQFLSTVETRERGRLP